MKTEQDIKARIKLLNKEVEEIKEWQGIEYRILDGTKSGGSHIRATGVRIAENEDKMRHILDKIKLLEWAMEGCA